MEEMLQQLLQAAKDKGKGKGKWKGKNQANKRPRTQKPTPLHRLTRLAVANARLSMSNARTKRQIIADLTHTAFNTTPAPQELQGAIAATRDTKGTDRRSAAKTTFLALCKGLVESKKVASGATEAFNTIKQFYNSKVARLDEKIIECRSVVTYNESMIKTSWWIKHLNALDEAVQDALVCLGADIRHGPCPMFGEEREVLDALADVVGTDQAATSSTDY